MGFNYDEIMTMPEGVAWEYLQARDEMNNPSTGGKKMVVKKRNK
jgi:hypothetical protein